MLEAINIDFYVIRNRQSIVYQSVKSPADASLGKAIIFAYLPVRRELLILCPTVFFKVMVRYSQSKIA